MMPLGVSGNVSRTSSAIWSSGIRAVPSVLTVMLTNWALKVGWEVVLTPATYLVVGFLKTREGVDVFDQGTDFTPFATRV